LAEKAAWSNIAVKQKDCGRKKQQKPHNSKKQSSSITQNTLPQPTVKFVNALTEYTSQATTNDASHISRH